MLAIFTIALHSHFKKITIKENKRDGNKKNIINMRILRFTLFTSIHFFIQKNQKKALICN